MVNDIPIALFNIKGKIHAWDNRCPHRGGSLADGNISNKIIQCKFHLWEFNVDTACAVANSVLKVKTFEVSPSSLNTCRRTVFWSSTSIIIKFFGYFILLISSRKTLTQNP